MSHSQGKPDEPIWLQPDGVPVSCREKIKVLNENFQEISDLAQDALEDGILMGCTEAQLRQVLHLVIDQLKNPYADKKKQQP